MEKTMSKRASSITKKNSDFNALNGSERKHAHSISNSFSLNSFHAQFLESRLRCNCLGGRNLPAPESSDPGVSLLDLAWLGKLFHQSDRRAHASLLAGSRLSSKLCRHADRPSPCVSGAGPPHHPTLASQTATYQSLAYVTRADCREGLVTISLGGL